MQSNLASKREYNFERFEQTQQAPKIERLPRREKLPHEKQEREYGRTYCSNRRRHGPLNHA